MSAYVVLLLAVLSRILPHAFHTTSVNFTAVGGGLLYFGARRPRWQTIFAMLAMILTDVYLTTQVYGLAFHVRGYLVTWIWYGAVCLMGGAMLGHRRTTALRVAGAVAASATSFFVLSNFVVWAGSGMYPHSLAGLGMCYVAAIPFYANDVMSTAVTAGALFGLPVLARSIADGVRRAQGGQFPLG